MLPSTKRPVNSKFKWELLAARSLYFAIASNILFQYFKHRCKVYLKI